MQITTCTSVSYIQSAICKPVKDVIGLEHNDMRHKEPFDGVRSAYSVLVLFLSPTLVEPFNQIHWVSVRWPYEPLSYRMPSFLRNSAVSSVSVISVLMFSSSSRSCTRCFSRLCSAARARKSLISFSVKMLVETSCAMRP